MSDEPKLAIDPFAEDAVLLSDLLKQLPHQPAAPVVSRWCTVGVRGVKLATVKLCGRHVTTKQAFLEFLAAIQVTGSGDER